ncbi:hypothetical protein MKX07_000480 [Trichoderma sp. CBMAI-0711]|nr:hypothetical protein MKX07_000480 [Trichoderma sp. CBMAI-0711]
MKKRYPPLLPSVPGQPAGPAEASSSSQQLKRRRTGVSVACNACRRKKIRCDGLRPTCSTCRELAVRCTYRDDYKLTPEAQGLLVEVMRLLNSLPEREAIRMLRYLKSETDAAVILSTLRGGISAIHQPSELRIAVATMDNSFHALQLGSQNPVAYPYLPPLQPQALPRDDFRRLTTMGSKPSSPYSPSRRMPWDRDPTESQAPLCDERLHQLDISHWTNAPINNESAARAISLYLETDHPLLGFFEPNLFVSDLINHKHDYCSPMLVNSLLYWACQMYSAVDPGIDALAAYFCAEAETIWRTERESDSLLNLTSALFLGLGYLGQGRDHAVLSYTSQATKMATRLGLFGVDEHSRAKPSIDKLSKEAASAYMYAAWGSFNWISLMSLFYRQPGILGPRSPPSLPIPGMEEDIEAASSATSPAGSPRREGPEPEPQSRYMGGVFPYLCQFWSIMYEVSLAYDDSQSSLDSQGTLSFAEHKFRQLLAWSNSLPSHLLRANQNPHYVQILQPCIQEFGVARLRTMVRSISSPDIVYAASVAQLKDLVLKFRLHFASSTYTVLWHTALIYITNELLTGPKDNDWFFYFLICVYGYERLSRSWRVTTSISRALLSMALRKGGITSTTARTILKDLGPDDFRKKYGEIRATFMADLDMAEEDPSNATVERQAEDFEHNAMLRDYTNILDADEAA